MRGVFFCHCIIPNIVYNYRYEEQFPHSFKGADKKTL